MTKTLCLAFCLASLPASLPACATDSDPVDFSIYVGSNGFADGHAPYFCLLLDRDFSDESRTRDPEVAIDNAEDWCGKLDWKDNDPNVCAARRQDYPHTGTAEWFVACDPANGIIL